MKKQKFQDTDFLYISTRLNSAEKDMISGDKLTRLVDAKDYDEAYAIACEMYGVSADSYGADYTRMLSAQLENAYAFATELIGSIIDMDEKPYFLLDPFRYVYDCQNLKAAIKCEALGKEPTDIISDNGSVSRDKLISAVSSRDFSVYPENMAQAALKACEQLASTGDPQEVDLILDKAAFEDMKKCAQDSGFEYLNELIRVKADSVNITTALRCIKQKKNRQYMQKLFVPGGSLDEDFFMSNYDETVSKLISALAITQYSAIAKNSDAQTGISATDAERLCSLIYLSKANSIGLKPFGAELACCYIVRKEYEIKNVRIILAGKACGLSAEKIKERLMIGA